MTHYAVKIAYLGWLFSGSQRQPHSRTVEGDIMDALKRIGAAQDYDSCDLRSAGRTDKGVSALGNVVCFHSDMAPEKLFPALAANLSDIFPWAYAEVGPDFNPRRAKERWYRHWLADKGHDLERMKSAAVLYEGYHDFTRFAKLEEDRSPMRRVNSVSVEKDGELITLDFRGESFLWNMVRRMAGALDKVGLGECAAEDIAKALEMRGDIIFPPLPPGALVLMDVDYGLDMKPVEMEGRKNYMEEMLWELREKTLVLETILQRTQRPL